MHVLLCAAQPARTAPSLCGNVFVVDHITWSKSSQEIYVDSEPLRGVLLSWAGCERFFNLVDMFHLPCVLDLESEPTT